MWLVKVLDCRNSRLQTWHSIVKKRNKMIRIQKGSEWAEHQDNLLNGFSPVWIFMWLANVDNWRNCFSQTLHWNGFSLLPGNFIVLLSALDMKPGSSLMHLFDGSGIWLLRLTFLLLDSVSFWLLCVCCVCVCLGLFVRMSNNKLTKRQRASRLGAFKFYSNKMLFARRSAKRLLLLLLDFLVSLHSIFVAWITFFCRWCRIVFFFFLFFRHESGASEEVGDQHALLRLSD